MTYNFKVLQEMAWAAGVAAFLVILQTLVLFDPEEIKDWETWFVALGGAIARAVGGAIIAKFFTK